jgi:hypothetical protein
MTAPVSGPLGEGGQPGPAAPKPTGAGIGGVGAGTGLVAIAQAVGPGTALGATLLYLAPAVSFTLGLAFYYMQVQVSRYFERRLVRIAKRTLEEQLDNPRTSATHKVKIRKMLEELETSVAAAELERVRLVGQPARNLEVISPPLSNEK